MKILVTGATGFVGSHLCDLLSKKGHNVFCLVRNPNKAKNFNLQGTFIFGDLHPTKELTWIETLPSDLDIVIHTAGIVHSNNTKDFYDFNANSTENLIRSLAKKYPSLHFTYISSQAAAGPAVEIDAVHEDLIPNPVSEYGKSKLVGEILLKEMKMWSTSVIRPPMVIGPRDTAVLDIFKMVKSRFIIGPGLNFKTKKYSFINVFDLIEAIAKISEEKISDTFFIAHPQTITFHQLISAINIEAKKLIFIPIPHRLLKLIASLIKFVPVSERLTADKIKELTQNNWVCDGSKFQKQVKGSYSYDLDSTVAMTLKDYKERKWL